MAKAKKQALTPEELLEQALVPESEQPYAVPRNWVWVRLLSVFINMTSSHKKLQQKDYLDDGLYAVVDQGKELVGGYTDDEALLYDGDLPIIVFGDHTRIVKYIDFQFAQGADGLKLLYPRKFINEKFFYYALQNVDIPDLGYRRHFPLFSQFNLPLPPLAEQRRIVACIESLFEKLDRAKELAQNALDSFETRKAAILHKAFTGELTAHWREQNDMGMESWENTTLGQICKIGSGGTPSRTIPQFYKGKTPWVKTGEIDWNIITDTEEHITAEAIENSSAKMFPMGTVLVAMYGQGLTRGRAAILGIDATTNQAVCALIPSGRIQNRYLYYYFMCNYWELREKAVGGNQPNFSGTMISTFSIQLPTLPEQQEIVRIIDSLFDKEQHARELYDIIEKIDLMKKAILARAFRGELGTNDPSEESAVELLKEVLVNGKQ